MIDIYQAIRPKTVPIRSIILTKIDQNMPVHDFICTCQMCLNYQPKKLSSMLQIHTQAVTNKISTRMKTKHQPCTPYYLWIIKHMLIPHNKIITRGLDSYIPQILFYKEGEANNLFCNRQCDDPVIKRAHKQKLSNTFILKIFGERRRRYRQIINTYLGKKKQVIQKPKFGAKKQPKKQSRDGVVIKYMDGLEQLISQNQFLHLFQRRKQDPLWKQIYYIKNYIAVEDPLKRIIVVKYTYNDIIYQQLYKRANILMRVYGQNIHEGQPNYISDKQQDIFCKNLRNQSLQIYGEYLLYKIVNYVQYFYDEKVLNITVKFLINQIGQGYLDDVMRLSTESLTKFEWTNQTYLRKIDQEEQRVFFSKKIETNQQIERNAKQIQKQMGKTYEKMKQYFGLSMQEQDDRQQVLNNEYFKLIHPQIPNPISQILKSRTMTAQKFKRDFLGYKPKKKPLIKPFNSNMIKSLHNMTPQLHRAQPHHYIHVPKRSISTAFTRSSHKNNNTISLKKTFTGYSSFNTTVTTPRQFKFD